MEHIKARLRITLYKHEDDTVDYQIWRDDTLIVQRKGFPDSDGLYEYFGRDVLDSL